MFLGRWWRKRRRDIDRRIFFPELRRHARDEDDVQAALDYHVSHDKAWRYFSEWVHEDIETGGPKPCGPYCQHKKRR